MLGSLFALTSGLVMMTRMPQLPFCQYGGMEFTMGIFAFCCAFIFWWACYATLADVSMDEQWNLTIFYCINCYIVFCMIALEIVPQMLKLLFLVLANSAFFAAGVCMSYSGLDWAVATLKLNLLFFYAFFCAILILHGIHSVVARRESLIASCGLLAGECLPPWLTTRFVSWTNMGLGIGIISLVVPYMYLEMFQDTISDAAGGMVPFQGERLVHMGWNSSLGLAAIAAIFGGVFAIIGGACECFPPINVLLPCLCCLNLGTASGTFLMNLMAYVCYNIADFWVIISVLKAHERTLETFPIHCGILYLNMIVDALFIFTTMCNGLKYFNFCMGQLNFATTFVIFYFDEVKD